MKYKILALFLLLAGCATPECALDAAAPQDAGEPDAADAHDGVLNGGEVLCALANRVSDDYLDEEGGACGQVTCPWVPGTHCDAAMSVRCSRDLLLEVDSCREFWIVWATECAPACEAF